MEMENDHATAPEPEVLDDDEVASPNALVERLRAQRQALNEDRMEVFPLPGYDELGMKYRVIDDSRLKKLLVSGDSKAERRRKIADRDFVKSAAELIVESAVEAMIWKDDDWHPAHEVAPEVFGTTPSAFDKPLVKLLCPDDPEPPSARAALHMVIPLTMALLDHSSELMKWQQGENRQVDKEILGE